MINFFMRLMVTKVMKTATGFFQEVLNVGGTGCAGKI